MAQIIPIPIDFNGSVEIEKLIAFYLAINVICISIMLFRLVQYYLDKSFKYETLLEFVIFPDGTNFVIMLNTCAFICINLSALIIYLSNIIYSIIK